MSSVNKVTILGNVGQDVAVNTLPSGKMVANLSVATTDVYKDKDGNRQEKTEWHRIVLFDKLAEIAEKYVTKGSKIYVEGKIQSKKFTNKDGIEVTVVEILGNELKMLGGNNQAQNNNSQGQNQQRQQSSNNQQGQKPRNQNSYQQNNNDFEDCPF